ncbi:hypothetical protein LXA43DRAFT_714629 [Ganoderma leucocontextum]|nr:hypothetical protein LXA43DRAFT_714629 [Ganoderma leucocontextum]
MTGALLPHALLDLTLARASARFETVASRCLRHNAFVTAGRRYAHQSVSLENVSPSEYVSLGQQGDRSFYSRRQVSQRSLSALELSPLFPHIPDGSMTELEKRIAELKETPVAETEIQEESPLMYADADLISMYEDLLAVPSRTQQQEDAVVDSEEQEVANEAVVRGAVQLLYALEGSNDIATDVKSQYTAAISKLREIVEALELARDDSGLPAQVSVLRPEEWVSLIRVCAEEQDRPAAEAAIDLMKRSGSFVPEVALETVASLYADVGDVTNTERFLRAFVGPSPSGPLRDIHIKAHIRALEPRTFPTHALSLLHDYETRALPAPQRSYTRLITNLLSLRSSVAEAQAWDLFSHMRYVAHPNPDPYLYTIMISACASRVITPQPARALDLFTEMTVDKRIPPTAQAYTAAIYACARSGEKLYVGEAFRLAKEMLDGNRDAYGNPAFTPDRRTFCALLEGAKRIGDLAKVRWILAEIVALGLRVTRGDVRDLVVVNEEIMTHVFHAYAAYRTPFIRASAPLVEQNGDAPSDAETPVSAEAQGAESAATKPEDVGQTTAEQEQTGLPIAPEAHHFTAILPQSHAEVLYEARALFARTVHTASPREDPMLQAFDRVELTPRLLNAFLSVHYAHALFGESTQLYRTLFAEHGVGKNAWTHVEALERAARAKRGAERQDSLKFAREVWAEWQPMEEAWWRREGRNEARVDARLVERAYVAMIHVLSRMGHAREAVRLVRTFVDRYPPNMIRTPNAKHALRSTRTVLVAPRPIVRMMSPTDVPDDTVPPLLTFPELEVLHHKLVAIGDRENIGYIKYVCMSYQGALKRRKEAALHAKPVTDANSPGAPKDCDTEGTQERD